MLKQHGSSMVTGLVVLAVAGVLSFGLIGSYISYGNYGVEAEAGIKAKYADNENVYANGTQKVIEIAQVPAMYADDIARVTKEAISGRYGADGSKAVFQMLQEKNPTIDASMYTKIQQVIEAFRNEFKNAQTALLDRCQTYEKQRGYFWSGFWLRVAGYPKNDLSKMCTIVSTTKARETFETKTDTGIQLRKAP